MPFKIKRGHIEITKADVIVVERDNEGLFPIRQNVSSLRVGHVRQLEMEVPMDFTLLEADVPESRVGAARDLQACYQDALRYAEVHLQASSVAFSLLGKRLSKEDALDAATTAIHDYLEHSELQVTLVVSSVTDIQLPEDLTEDVADFLKANYRPERPMLGSCYHDISLPPAQIQILHSAAPTRLPQHGIHNVLGLNVANEMVSLEENDEKDLKTYLSHTGESFRDRLFRMIRERNLTDAEVYKGANLTRQLFSKINCNDDYLPKKPTVLALVFGLKLDLDSAKDLLMSAGYALSDNNKQDVIVRYCLEKGIYNLTKDVNQLLVRYGCQALGS